MVQDMAGHGMVHGASMLPVVPSTRHYPTTRMSTQHVYLSDTVQASERSEFVRGEVVMNGWHVEPLEGNAEHCAVTFVSITRMHSKAMGPRAQVPQIGPCRGPLGHLGA